MKLLIKTSVAERFGDQTNNSGKVDVDELLSKLDGLIALGDDWSEGHEADDFSDWLDKACSMAYCLFGYDDNPTTVAGKVRELVEAGEGTVGFWDDEVSTAFVLINQRPGEDKKAAWTRINDAVDNELRRQIIGAEVDEGEFDEDDF